MRKWLWSLILATAAAGCGSEARIGDDGAPSAPVVRVDRPLPFCADIGLATPLPLAIDTVAAGLEAPWDLTFLPDGRILVTERPGRVRVILPGEGLLPEPWAVVDVEAVAEAGLLGIDLSPDFPMSGDVYLLGTFRSVPQGRIAQLVSAVQRRIVGQSDPDAGTTWRNRVIRLTDRENSGTNLTVIVDQLPSGPVHAGGALRFGSDSFLYITQGDGTYSAAASDWSSLRGKILRYDLNGKEAPGNPLPGSPIYATGFRNPQGLVWDPRSGALFAPDHGPTGMPHERRRSDHDELNRVIPGADYGWDAVAGMWSGEGIETPLAEWVPAIAPAGIALVDDAASLWHGDLFLTGLVSQRLVRVVLNREGAGGSQQYAAACTEPLLHEAYGRLRAIRSGPDGSLYLTTSNRDQRGSARPTDDLLLRIIPPRKTGQ